MYLLPLSLITTLLAGVLNVVVAAETTGKTPDQLQQQQKYRQLVQEMKNKPRGPFARLRWFCNDGSVLPPKAYACVEHGGGRQHGEWSADTKTLRDAGYLIGNVLAAANTGSIARNYSPVGALQAILIENFLIEVDDGWILRKARFYRGAFQDEDERRAAADIVKQLTASGRPIAEHYLLTMDSAKQLRSDSGDLQLQTNIRNTASAINKANADFTPLRNKIHGKIDLTDADRVRDFAASRKQDKQYDTMLKLAADIDRLFSADRVADVLTSLTGSDNAEVAQLAVEALNNNSTTERFRLIGQIAVVLRNSIEREVNGRNARLTTVAELEQAQFALGSNLVQQQLDTLSRAQLLNLLLASQDMLYATGLLTEPEKDQSNDTIHRALATDNKLADYQEILSRLSRVPVWGERRVQFFYAQQVGRFAEIEPLAVEFVPARLRSSPLFFYSAVLKVLSADAARLGGVKHQYFGRQINDGLRPLNPGIARGFIHTPESLAALDLPPEDVILVVPETLADLPPVNGLLTAFEGNQLSHVQLLARNLGVPNVVVSRELLESLNRQQGKFVELLASKGGVVSITETNPVTTDSAITTDTTGQAGVLIQIDEEKLDLTQTLTMTTFELGSDSSGVTVGPKAAKVAELNKLFPRQTSPGLAIPFGVFRKMLDDNQHASGQTMFSWIKSSYEQLSGLQGAEQAAFRERFLSELRNWFLTVELDPDFIADLRLKMSTEFGPDGSYGVFVRSDTNVEDLPGFTGAGLNLTVPHVVGVDNIIQAVRRVWASPFTERAFGWRQARMDKPEHVYTAILLHKSVPAETSGVFVTTDVFDGQQGKISVVLNEGVGGGVDGLSAESLRIDRNTAAVERMASATAPFKRVLLDQGGVATVPASGKAVLLSEINVRALLDFSSSVGSWFSNDPDAIADVEFAFLNNKFVPLQIRPLVEPPADKLEVRLQQMDEALSRTAATPISLSELPR